MTLREINRMDQWERSRHLRAAAAAVDRALNLYGVDAEPISDIIDADTDAAIDRVCDDLLTPECRHRRGTCDHAFPPHFVRSAVPQVNALRRLAKQLLHAT